jgi:uncharacterized protein YbaR (Trm112 family)
MIMSETTQELPISEDLLEILRDPAAVQEPQKYGEDPGQLELVHNSWLVSKDTGYKYPIRDGIPVMLIEEGERWKDTAIEDLPVPPETAEPLPAAPEQSDLYVTSGDSGGINPIFMVIGGLLAVLAFIGIWRWLSSDEE